MFEPSLQRAHGIFGIDLFASNLVANFEVQGKIFMASRKVLGGSLFYTGVRHVARLNISPEMYQSVRQARFDPTTRKPW